MEPERKMKRIFRTIDSKVPDEDVWESYWKDKTAEEKLNAVEIIIRGSNATNRLQRVFRVIERV